MANIKSAIKRIKTTRRNRLKNLEYLGKIKKSAKLAIKTKKAEDIKAAISAIDKAAKKNVVHKNYASRKKSALMKLAAKSK